MQTIDMHDETIFILPQRFIPFDFGMYLTEDKITNLRNYFEDHNYSIVNIPGFMTSLSKEVKINVKINSSLRLYIYSYGIGVWVLDDMRFPIKEKYAVDYCSHRKESHNKILEFTYGEFSSTIKHMMDDFREIVKEKKTQVRDSAAAAWEHNGLSYVMTVSYLINYNDMDLTYNNLDENQQKDLQIMLRPSLAHKEDTIGIYNMNDNESFDPYDFNIKEMDNPKDWASDKDCAIYISWAAVVVSMHGYLKKYMEIVECMEADLQAMWFYTYCLHQNLRHQSASNRLSSGRIKREKYTFQKRFSDFISDDDSSLPMYVYEIRNEMIRTSGIEREKDNYIEYLNFCIDESESQEIELQKKYSIMNEVLLFIIAFIQIAPMLYSVMIGEVSDLQVMPIAVMVIVVFIAIYLIVRKDL